ncbi:SIS domain-containing protein [Mesorhizobium sp. INR15]|uniref:SIS domain-containing protein n=1 Tax=Mesorhizobium sp. INR15 TaxID=2654248 RepID=UPI0018969971|nr:SIS domain-containing protein [Mesorhizobium sp. INR15]QPC91785.1 SIS domain-containing protein [Mesorhizobium sp. INR15]
MSAKQQTRNDPLERWVTFNEAMAQPGIWRGWADPLGHHAEAIAAWIAERGHAEIWFCGAGTSAFIGDTLCAYLNAPPRQPRFRSVPTTDLVSCPGNFVRTDRRILVVSFGRSGNSSETIGALDLLDAHMPGADRLHFTCNAAGALATRQPPGPGEQRTVVMPAGTNDAGFAMTSSYTTMLLSALACFDPHPPLALGETLGRLADAGETVLDAALLVARAGRRPPSRAVFLGCGPLTGSARESALKVLELAHGNIPTAWDSTLGFRHGPKAVVDAETRVHVLMSSDPHTRRYDLDAANEIRAQFGAGCAVTLGPDKANVDLHVPMIGNDAWSSVLYVLAAQIQAIAWSDALRINVDNPFTEGNLSRVVDGVTLYPYPAAH